MDVRVGPERRLSVEESMLLSCGAGDLENPLDCKETKLVSSEGNQP